MAEELDSWSEYRRLVLTQLEGLHSDLRAIHSKIDEVRERDIHALWLEMNTLKVKAGVWGVIAGSIPMLVSLILNLYSKWSKP